MQASFRLALGAAVSLAVIAHSGVASAQDFETQNVDADINSALQLDIESSFAPATWMLTSGQNNVNNSLSLRAFGNVQYGISVNHDDPGTKPAGQENNLCEYAGGYLSGTTNHPDGGTAKCIFADLLIRDTGPGGQAVGQPLTDPTSPSVMTTGQNTTATGGRVHSVEISQLVDFGDKSLQGTGSGYHMEITFTILAGL